MKFPSLPKFPGFPKLPKLRAPAPPRPRRLQATARRAAQPAIDQDDDQPTTRLSSAFIIVLILHVVAVGGIWAFNSLKAHRRGNEPVVEKSDRAAKPAVAGLAGGAEGGAEGTRGAAQVEPVPAIPGGRVHQVRPGDNLTKLATMYGVSVEEIEQANGMKNGAILRQGQNLAVPPAKSAGRTTPADTKRAEFVARSEATAVRRPEAATAKPVTTKATAEAASATRTYTVKKGDNPVAIARALKVSYTDLLKVNGITDPKKLQPGRVLKVPGKKSE